MSKFSATLKSLMKSQKVTAKEVCLGTGIPKTTFSEWTNGREPTATEALVKLAKFFNVTVEFLITGEDSELDLINELIGDDEENFVSIHKGVYRISIEKKVTTKR